MKRNSPQQVVTSYLYPFKSLLAALWLSLAFVVQAIAAPVNVNSADAQSLAKALNGVGPKIAASIVSYRKEHGSFKSTQDLLKVKGIGPKMLERIKHDILLSGSSGAAKTANSK